MLNKILRTKKYLKKIKNKKNKTKKKILFNVKVVMYKKYLNLGDNDATLNKKKTKTFM